MPSSKTEATELTIGFGLLGLDPNEPIEADIAALFEGTLTSAKLRRFNSELARNPVMYRRLWDVGTGIRKRYAPLTRVASVRWTGPEQQATTTSFSKDLEANHIPISVKVNSNVVLNPSPYNLFSSIPRGTSSSEHSENWYISVAPDEFQGLYAFVSQRHPTRLPEAVKEFEKTASRSDRRRIQSTIASLSETGKDEFYLLYVSMCNATAIRSAEAFNEQFQASLRGNTRASVLEIIARNFFRLDAVRYLLCGIDCDRDFAVEIQELTEWKRHWRILSVTARPDLDRKQSVVDFEVLYETRETNERQLAKVHSEIRWSHGKFCGVPEAKLYKEFAWNDVAFFRALL